MNELFLSVLNMSLTASYVILVVMLIRLLLKKAPKVISYMLWGVVAFRLIVPFTFESVFSLLPRNGGRNPIPQDSIHQQSPQSNSGIEEVDSFVSGTLPAPTVGDSVNHLQNYLQTGSYIWALGIMALLIYSLVSVLLLKRQLKNAQLIEKNIYEATNLKTPFVLGLIRPRIYLPVGLHAEERSFILLHEQTHIKRYDHIIKLVAFLVLSVHWFNPLVWVAFMLMSRDMEFSCDERVLKSLNYDTYTKKSYASSLLSLATDRQILNGSPLAFGEGNVKGRIKNVLNYKKPRFWVLVFSIVMMIAVGVGLIANPKIKSINELEKITVSNNISSGEEIDFELPEKSAAEILGDLANQRFIIKGNQVSDDDQETVLAFGKAFVNLYTGAIAEQKAVSFKYYISNENLLTFTNRMLKLEQEKELMGGIGVIFGLENEFGEAEFKKLDENLYYVSLPFSNQGSGMNFKMLVQAENKALKMIDLYFGNKDGVDTIVTGHPADRKLHDPKLWDNQAWVDVVFEKLENMNLN
ncbi:M56 family metallopeptidase [Lederbergia wuyishanensis]|uniref:Beta-lactamase regulating signal transducer with metallopeptidase domain n=1 Tax=Lederbergia wuyishanensis TaxID=1347903 RepID=A0ABU0D2V5_9BACI|nr:M56 family metallopeptidase [Lederbergia wuyishanensis]MCJ8007126.1 M56 family metallopeptidase [Lederbergia wuyishanensis]MDQ0342729.1 beta-lactamase regulating signal transducer with metallopeptidase domain [Lederbergia wuyishanensis]